jgi:hypothetical protein
MLYSSTFFRQNTNPYLLLSIIWFIEHAGQHERYRITMMNIKRDYVATSKYERGVSGRQSALQCTV